MSGANAIADRRISELLDALASDDASPGAGAAAAVALALAAACARKAVAISLKHRGAPDAALMRASEDLRDIAHRAMRGADEDARRFEEFLHSQDAHAAEKLTHAERSMQQLARELLLVLSEVKDQIAPVVAGDVLAAGALCRAVLAIEANNVEESVRMTD